MKIKAERLPTGYWRISGEGPCNFAQPPYWPCDDETLRAHAFFEASEEFIRAATETSYVMAGESEP